LGIAFVLCEIDTLVHFASMALREKKHRVIHATMMVCFVWLFIIVTWLSITLRWQADGFRQATASLFIPDAPSAAKFIRERKADDANAKNNDGDISDSEKLITPPPSSAPPPREPYVYHPHSSDPRPRNLRLAFLGDSIARYQYLSLVYFLKTGQWITAENMGPKNPCFWQTYGTNSRDDFFHQTNQLLFPYEICDCHELSENRYFADPVRGNYVSFIVKFGRKENTGQWLPEEVHDRLLQLSQSQQGTNSSTLAFRSEQEVLRWTYTNWNDTIHQHIAQLQPKPDYLIFNAGLHKHDLSNPEVPYSILNASLQNNMIPIYKTTTYPNYSLPIGKFHKAAHDKDLCGPVFRHCLDYSWTAPLRGYKDYFDIYHLKPQHNQRMNLQTLKYLQEISSVAPSIL
jgi:hypothetical protein